MNLRRMRIADFAGVTYGTSRKLQAADDVKASVSLCVILCGIALKKKPGFRPVQGKTRPVYSSALYAATAPAAEMISTASAEVTKSKNACAVSLSATPSFVTSTNGRCTT